MAKKAWHLLDFSMQQQDQTNWCWAAVAASVVRYYHADTQWTQCRIAEGELQRADCCDGEDGGLCNVYGFLPSALYRVGCLKVWDIGKRALLEQLCAEIDEQRPLCARVQWQGGGAHFVAIVGYLEDGDLIAVEDPFWGPSDIAYNTFCTHYTTQQGSWTDAYYTSQ